MTQALRKFASDVRIFLEFLPRYKEIYTSVLDILKLGVYPNIFLLGKRSHQIMRYFKTVQGMKLEFEESPLQVGCSGFEVPKNHALIQEEVSKLLKKSCRIVLTRSLLSCLMVCHQVLKSLQN